MNRYAVAAAADPTIDLTTMPAHHSPGGYMQQPMSKHQAADILSMFPDGPTSDDCMDWNNYASALYLARRDVEALAAAEHAVSLDRESISLLNLGVILEGFGRFAEALLCFYEAQQADTKSVLAGAAYADALVRMGRWNAGWPLYGYYHSRAVIGRITPLNEMAGKRVLIIQAGGAGDNIYHLRWMKALREANCEVTYAGPASLIALFKDHPWIDNFLTVPQSSPMIHWYVQGPMSHADETSYCINLNEFDHYLSTLSLAAAVGPKLNADIWPGTYIDTPKTSPWKVLLQRRLRVGLSWKAGESKMARAHKSLRSEQVARLVSSCPKFNWISLVVDEPPPRGVAPTKITNWMDSAREIASCDLVVSVDTGIAHLAGAMGKPVYVVLPGASAWPYGLAEDYKMAYPSMTAFRNPRPVIDDSLNDLIGALHEVS